MEFWSSKSCSTGQFVASGFSVHHDSLVSIKQQPHEHVAREFEVSLPAAGRDIQQQPYEHVQLCCPYMESLPIEKYKRKPTDNIRPVLESLHAYW